MKKVLVHETTVPLAIIHWYLHGVVRVVFNTVTDAPSLKITGLVTELAHDAALTQAYDSVLYHVNPGYILPNWSTANILGIIWAILGKIYDGVHNTHIPAPHHDCPGSTIAKPNSAHVVCDNTQKLVTSSVTHGSVTVQGFEETLKINPDAGTLLPVMGLTCILFKLILSNAFAVPSVDMIIVTVYRVWVKFKAVMSLQDVATTFPWFGLKAQPAGVVKIMVQLLIFAARSVFAHSWILICESVVHCGDAPLFAVSAETSVHHVPSVIVIVA